MSTNEGESAPVEDFIATKTESVTVDIVFSSKTSKACVTDVCRAI